MTKIKIKFDDKNKVNEEIQKALERRLDNALNDGADRVGTESDKNLRDDEHGSFDTGFLAGSLVVDKEKYLYKEIGYGAMYAPFIEYGCFFDPKTKVLTISGGKNIKDIKENDIVLTHIGEWKKVLKTIKYEINEIVEEYIIKIGRKTLRVTAEHPILIRNNDGIEEWKLAKNIKIGDEIVLLKYNGMDLPGVQKIHDNAVKDPINRKKFSRIPSNEELIRRGKSISKAKIEYYKSQENRDKTGESLRNSKNFQDKMKDEEYRIKVTNGVREYYENNDAWNKGLTKENNDSIKSTSEKNSQYMKQYYKNNPEEACKRAEDMRKRSMFFNTKIEKKVDEELNRNNINHKNQYRVWDETYRRFYNVDHYLPEYNLIIEDYGNYWHNFPNGNDQDRKRIDRIKELGYNILILWENDIKNNNFIEVIIECIKNIKK